ncbi:NADP-dependent oxidoreductase [Sphingomonas sp. OK281]|uniref:NADP-dependent oxidoreductase n=1 Tax=Sphingomonas sp. OK281 TaxID=1881067 RepID=UPI0008E177AA|nr:NADP-dependent oxidoreductase [Sphingomonas sp. OK281]SFO33382.1 NADPH:quinone reductase [Sphingomonas sp. OK281]
MAESMKAVRQFKFGGPEVLVYGEAPKPELKAGEILVRVHAVGLNPPDWYLREGFEALPPEWRPEGDFPITLGTDVSGVVDKIADDVEEFAIGDEVYSMVRFPEGMFGDSRAYAEFVSVPAIQAAKKPFGIDHAHAGAVPMSLLTAWQFLIAEGHDVPNPIQSFPHVPVPLEGKTVLVNGAAGGVGHFAMQIAKWKGARVIAVASGEHESFLRDLGADEFIDYTKTPPEDFVRDVDLVVDTIGGPTTSRFLRVIKAGGALFPIFGLGASGGEEAGQRDITISTTQVRSSGAQLAEIGRLLDNGTIRVAIDSSFPLADARKAHERAAKGHIRGKIILTVA